MSEEDVSNDKTLGDFRILREIGRGGMGTVYLAEQISLRRTVALKVLHPGVSLNANVVRRFHREAEAAGRLRHPNIVQVFAVGEQDGTHFFAMEYVQGESLDQIARRMRKGGGVKELSSHPSSWSTDEELSLETKEEKKRVTQESLSTDEEDRGDSTVSETQEYILDAARLMAEVADALDYSHRHGIIHRDVKPHNIIVDRVGRPYLVDFGLAHTEGSMGITKTGEVFGTPTYMSPEQVAGSLADIDHRTDVYSLGCSFYEMLTLDRPFDGKTPQETVRKILTVEPKDPSKLNPAIPKDLATIILKSLEKDPDKRFSNCASLQADLKRFLAGDPIEARPISWLEHSYRYVSRRRGASAAVAVIGVLLMVLVYLGGKTSTASRSMHKAEGEMMANQARTLYESGRILESERVLEQGLDRDPQNAKLHLLRGKILRGQNKIDDALVAFAQSSRLDPTDAQPFIERANLFLARKEFQDAADSFRSALTLDDSSPDLHDRLGDCLRELGSRQEANQEYEKAESLRSALATPFLKQGEVLWQEALALGSSRGRMLEAANQFTKAIESYPNAWEGYARRGALYLDLGLFAQAKADLDTAIEKNPRNPDVLLDRGRLRIQQKDFEQAEADFERAWKLAETVREPANEAKARLWLAQLEAKRLEWKESLEHAKAAVELDRGQLQARTLLGLCYFELNQLNDAEREFQSIVTENPLDQLREKFAKIVEKLDQHDFARWRALKEPSLQALRAHMALALIKEKQGFWLDALDRLTALDKDFGNEEVLILYHRARIGIGRRNDKSDREAVERMIAFDPESVQARLLRLRARLNERDSEWDFWKALDLDPEFTVQNSLEFQRSDLSTFASLKECLSATFQISLTEANAAIFGGGRLSKHVSGILKESNFSNLEERQRFLSPKWKEADLSPRFSNDRAAGITMILSSEERTQSKPNTCTPVDIDRWIAELRSPAPKVREMAEEDLGNCGWDAIVKLRSELDDPEFELTAKTLLERLEEKRKRAEYETLLVWLWNEEAPEKSKDPIAEFQKEAIPYLFEVLNRNPDRKLKHIAITKLMNISSPEVEQGLLKLLSSTEPVVRFYALRGIGASLDINTLAGLFRDKTASVRLAALVSMPDPTENNRTASHRILGEALMDEMPLVRWVAARWIGDREERFLLHSLRKAFQEETDPDVRRQMFRALHQIGDEAGTMGIGLSQLFSRSSTSTAGPADAILKIFKGNRNRVAENASAGLLWDRLANAGNSLARVSLIRNWGICRNAEHVDILNHAEQSGSELEKTAALWALIRLGLKPADSFNKLVEEDSLRGALARSLLKDGELPALDSKSSSHQGGIGH